jgi:topoisomerase IV subunit B
MATKKNSDYSESSIRVLKGLEPVKQRPGMYTRTENPLHIIQEVIDNASDEALGGFCKNIVVTLNADGSVSVEDDGRGIPVGLHPEEKVPTVEIVFTRLHAGGKFDKGSGGAYSFSGGLHGVGVSVTNALSNRLEITVWREGGVHQIAFSEGEVVQKLKSRPQTREDKKSGTRVTVWPNVKYFDSPAIPNAELHRLLRSKAVLLPGVKVTLANGKNGETQTWQYEQGLRGYLVESLAQASHAEPLIPLFEGEQFATADAEGFAEGEGASWVVAWTEDGNVVRESYVNLIPTPAGGTHESGLREGLFGAVKSFVEMHSLLPKGVKLLPEDVFARVSFVLSAKVLDPQFQGQIKERLNSRDAVRLVGTYTRSALELWLNHHVDYGRKLADLVIKQAQSRLRSAQKVEKKKSSGVAVLPGKLTDCESEDVTRNEIFLVEGDSAGGSAKSGRDSMFQAILPIRGKIINVEKARIDRVLKNTEVQAIITALGTGIHDEFDLSKLRYHKVVLMADADVDGQHIRTLLLTLLFRFMRPLVENGHIFLAQPPLYKLKWQRSEPEFAYSDRERDGLLEAGKKAGKKINVDDGIQRYKGLGEMDAKELWETTMDPSVRVLRQVTLDDAAAADELFSILMGEDVEARRSFITRNAKDVRFLDV